MLAGFNPLSAALMEQFANRVLRLDPESQAKLGEFSGKVIHIAVTDLQLDYYLLFVGGSLVVQSRCETKVSASISGKSFDYLAVLGQMQSDDPSNSADFLGGELHFSGEINTARRFQSWVQNLNLDWQEPLSQLFGDFIGHNIGQQVKQANLFAKRLMTNFKQDLPEYLQHEILVTPTAFEVKALYEDIELTRNQVDRLALRVARLSGARN